MYAGYVAEADSLAARSAWLADRIAAGDPPPAPELVDSYAVWSPPSPPSADSPQASAAGVTPGARPAGPPPRATAPTHPAPSAQTVLLGVGALLLVVAGAVFAAVVWDRLGAVGQVALMLVATTGIGALAVRLRRGLAGTAEALAAVAAGLAAVDVMAAPLLGLMPSRWVEDPTLYPAIALSALGLVLLLLGERFGLRAWSWLGWLGLLLGAWCVVPAVATATRSLDSSAWIMAAVAVPALASIGMLALGQQGGRWAAHRLPLLAVGSLGLAISALVATAGALSSSTITGALFTTAATAIAVGLWAVRDRGRTRLVSIGAAALGGITVALALGLPPDPQPVWLAAAVALAGLAVGLVLWVLGFDRGLAILGACAVWVPWTFLRISREQPASMDSDLVASQLSVLFVLVAVMAFVLAWWAPAAAWIAAPLAMAGLGLVPVTWNGPIEAYTLSFAALLLLAGLLWRRRGPTPSLQWLGPAVAMALVPSAIATWLAPWALDLGSESAAFHVTRLAAVLAVAVLAAVVGARQHLAGLLVPAAVALVIAAGAQVFSGLENLPRWVGLAIAGTLMVVAGARIEWLRGEGRRAVGWVGALR